MLFVVAIDLFLLAVFCTFLRIIFEIILIFFIVPEIFVKNNKELFKKLFNV